MTGRYLSQDRGFSLLEALVALSVFVLVLFAVYTSFASGAGTFAKGDVKAEIHQNARASMDLIVREIRLAGFIPEDFPTLFAPEAGGSGCAGPPFVGISTATATSITICGDVQDGDNNLLTNSSNLVTYTWVGDTNGNGIVDPGENEIRRQINGGAADVVALMISDFSFTYFDASNAEIAAPVDAADLVNIRRVVINMTAEQPERQSAAIGGRSRSSFATRVQNYQLITDIRPRNLLL